MKRLIQIDPAWVILWVVGSMGGWVVGFVINFVVRQLSGQTAFDRSYLGYVIFGICVGLCQWLVALRGVVNGIVWTIATGLAGTIIAMSFPFAFEQLIPPILEYYNPGCLSASCDSFTLRDTWLLGVVIISLIGGISVALPTSFALLRYGPKIHLWVVGSFVSSLLGVFGYLPFALIPGLDATLCYLVVLGPIVVSVASAPFMYITVHKPTGL